MVWEPWPLSLSEGMQKKRWKDSITHVPLKLPTDRLLFTFRLSKSPEVRPGFQLQVIEKLGQIARA